MGELLSIETELKPINDRCKSFYGKASVIYDSKTSNVMLKSYNTIVCYVDANDVLHKTWKGYSNTTMRHVREFVLQQLDHNITKKEWSSMTLEPEPIISRGIFMD